MIDLQTSANHSQQTVGFSFGEYPVKTNTVTAEVLARLLSYERMTSLETVYGAGTTRLAAVVHYLETQYGWFIAREDKAVGCKDGRVAYVSEYWIPPEVVAVARDDGFHEWCTRVKAARLKFRAKAALAEWTASKLNTARGRVALGVSQFGLFDGGLPC